jgi:hypothetical protein
MGGRVTAAAAFGRASSFKPRRPASRMLFRVLSAMLLNLI